MVWLSGDEDVQRVLLLAQLRISSDTRRGGDYAVLARTEQKLLDEHQPSGESGQPCTDCAQPWPCGGVRGIIQAYD